MTRPLVSLTDGVRLGRKPLRITFDSIERFVDARSAGNWL